MIGNVIRKYRTELNMTQEYIAKSLGVSAPAVNKWENGISYPDIELLAPLARLLRIDINTLLTFREELSDKEIGLFINNLSEKIMTIGFEEAFNEVEQKIREYPNCYKLILWSAQVLRGYLMMRFPEKKDEEKYSNKINEWIKKVALGDDVKLAHEAKISLTQLLIEKQDYEEAQKMLDQIPELGFDKRIIQGQLFVAQNKYEEAYKLQEEMMYQQANGLMNTILHKVSVLCKEHQYDEALYLANISCQIAEIMDLGNYIGNTAYFTVYAEMKEAEQTINYLEKMLEIEDTSCKPKDSRIYRHMKFNANDGFTKVYDMVVRVLESNDDIDFLKCSERYTQLLEKAKRKYSID